jgi:hypothetical protein
MFAGAPTGSSHSFVVKAEKLPGAQEKTQNHTEINIISPIFSTFRIVCKTCFFAAVGNTNTSMAVQLSLPCKTFSWLCNIPIIDHEMHNRLGAIEQTGRVSHDYIPTFQVHILPKKYRALIQFSGVKCCQSAEIRGQMRTMYSNAYLSKPSTVQWHDTTRLREHTSKNSTRVSHCAQTRAMPGSRERPQTVTSNRK